MTRSANLDFFAAEDDLRALLDFIFAETDLRVFESYSAYETDLREFRSTSELARAFELGKDKHGNGKALLLQMTSPSVVPKPIVRRIELDQKACNGHTFRFCIEGGSLMQLYLGGVHDRVITESHFGHGSQTWAQNWDLDVDIDWEAQKTLSNRLLYHLRKRMAVARAGYHYVMPQALALSQTGFALKPSARAPWKCEVDQILKPSTRK